MKYYITGDTHGVFQRLFDAFPNKDDNIGKSIIILGDAGVNYYLNKTDTKLKEKLQGSGILWYLVRGNHEQRPQLVEGMTEWYDEELCGAVYREPQFPNIRYLKDGWIYSFNGYFTLVIGGAYSVDKFYRLRMGSPYNWFADEQLTTDEMANIKNRLSGKHFDFILTHTCPYSWQPTDLFLAGLDQSTVDNTMELWFEDFKNELTWTAWLFGHFHDDRLVRPGVEMYYKDIEELDTIWDRYTSGEPIDWWLKKDPKYYMN